MVFWGFGGSWGAIEGTLREMYDKEDEGVDIDSIHTHMNSVAVTGINLYAASFSR